VQSWSQEDLVAVRRGRRCATRHRGAPVLAEAGVPPGLADSRFASPDDEIATGKQQIKDGIARYWSRNSSQDPKRKITINGVDYDVTTIAIEKGDGVKYTIEKGGIFNDRRVITAS
jgi:hypothetical protein